MTRSVFRTASVLVCLVVAASGASSGADPKQLKEELRDPWVRNQENYLRQWLVLGSFASDSADPDLDRDYLGEKGEANMRPKADDVHRLPDGTVLKWQPHSSFHDAVDFGGLPGSGGTNLVAYAFTTVRRPAAGKAVIALGSDEGVRVWANGKLVHDKRTRRSLTPDEDMVEVELEAGENALLVKSEQKSGPWAFTLRVLEPGATLRRRAEIGPSITSSEGGILVLRTDLESASKDEAPVTIEAVGAGGKTLAKLVAPRGDSVRFETGRWPDGAYEFRCSTKTFGDRDWVTHLPWYKGDCLAAARELVKAAEQADRTKPDGFTTVMLAEMTLDRLGDALEKVKGNPWWKVHSPLLEFEEIRLQAAGKGGAVRPYGFVRLAYLDEVDGSAQFCRAYLPPHYDPSRKWPLVIQLHGYHPQNPPYVRWYFVDSRHAPLNTEYADNLEVIVLEPHGRANTSYLGLGEEDVLRAIQMAKERFNVDDDRVYLMGESMGGAGVWNIATRHPGIFAAIAPTYGGFDIRAVLPEPELAKLNPAELFLLDNLGTVTRLDSLINLPIFVHHGDKDPAVNVEQSRRAVALLQRWGYDVRYREHPGGMHEDLKIADEIVGWFLEHRRNPMPRRVRVRSAELAYASAHWLQVEQADDPASYITVDSEVVGANTIRLDTLNVLRVSLSPAAPLVNPSKPLRIVWNGVSQTAVWKQGRVTLDAPGYSNGPRVKTPGRPGGIRDLYNTPFAIVVGTVSGSEPMREVCRKQGDAAIDFWKGWQNQPPRVFKDTELGDEEAKAYSLLLIGGPEANAVTRRFASELPLDVSERQVRIGGRSFEATDAGVQIIYPHPLNPARYLSVVTGTSAEGMSFWGSTEGNEVRWDYVVFDDKSSGLGIVPERLRVASGFFDRNWQFNEKFIMAGNADERARAMSARTVQLAPDLLAPLVGRYSIAPGVEVAVRLENGRLMADAPGQPPIELLARSATQFATADSQAAMEFAKDPSGKVTGVTIRVRGQEIVAKRVQ